MFYYICTMLALLFLWVITGILTGIESRLHNIHYTNEELSKLNENLENIYKIYRDEALRRERESYQLKTK